MKKDYMELLIGVGVVLAALLVYEHAWKPYVSPFISNLFAKKTA